MSLTIPASPLNGVAFHESPAEHKAAIESAQKLLEEHTGAASEDSWESAGEQQEVQLSKKVNPDDAYDVPWVRGVTTVENATPEEVLAVIQLAGMRRKWDARLDEAHPIKRYEPFTYLFYSVMKSPSYFIWARDIVGVQHNSYDTPSAGDITVLQKSVEAEDVLPDAGSYAKSRTRATVELSAWVLRAKGADTEVSYTVKIHLNGSIPTSVVNMIATETPMCVARVRDVLYRTGFAPYEVHTPGQHKKTVTATMEFDDGDGSEGTSGARTFTGYYAGESADEFHLRFDKQRMYPDGVDVSVQGDAKDDVEAQVDGDDKVKVTVKDGAKGKTFQVVISPK